MLKHLDLVETKGVSKDGKEYTYFSLCFIKKDGDVVEIKRIFLSDLEKEAIKMMELANK